MYNHGSSVYVRSRICIYGVYIRGHAPVYVYMERTYTLEPWLYIDVQRLYTHLNFAPVYVQSRLKCIRSLPYMYIRGVYTGSHMTYKRSIYFYVQSRFKWIRWPPYTCIYGVYTRGHVWQIKVLYTFMYNHISCVYVRFYMCVHTGCIHVVTYDI